MEFLTDTGIKSRYDDYTTKADADRAFDIASAIVEAITSQMS